jgi:predicted RNA-binding Zn-ribbon protein involved in translation (DUF1610 family)
VKSKMAGFLDGLNSAINSIASEVAKTSLAPQDDPNVKLLNAQSALADLRKKENEVYAQIGRAAFEANPNGFPQAEEITSIKAQIAEAGGKITALQEEIKALETVAEQACPNCGETVAEGVRFCPSCGAKINKICTNCGAQNAPETNFCNECGSQLN